MKTYSTLKAMVACIVMMLCGCVSQAQMVQMYSQGFEIEDGDQGNYTVSPGGAASPTNLWYCVGEYSLDITQSRTDTVFVQLSTNFDFTTNQNWQYFSLEFDHLCSLDGAEGRGCFIQYRYLKDTILGAGGWNALTGDEYNKSEEYSRDFSGTGLFSRNSYEGWHNGAIANIANEKWKHERFDLDGDLNLSSGLNPNERKVQLRFVVMPRGPGVSFAIGGLTTSALRSVTTKWCVPESAW